MLAGRAGSQTVTALTLPSGRRLWQTDLGCEPATLAICAGRVYVALVDTGELAVIDGRAGALLERRWVSHGPFGVLATSRRIFVTLPHDNALAVLDVRSLGKLRRVDAAREPRGLALHGNRLYAVRLLDASSLWAL